MSQTIPTTGGTINTTNSNGSTLISVDVPYGAFSQAEKVSVTTGIAADANAVLPRFDKAVLTIGVHFHGATLNEPITLVVVNSKLTPNDAVYQVSKDGKLTLLKGDVGQGKAVITITSDPNFIIANRLSLQGTKAIVVNGQTLYHVHDIVKNGTTYMPIWYEMQALKKVGIDSKWNGHLWDMNAPKGVIPDFHHIEFPPHTNSSIAFNGVVVEKAPAIVAVDPLSGKPTTYMPIWYGMQALLRVRDAVSWNGSEWVLGQPAPSNLKWSPLLQEGSTGPYVSWLQSKLGIAMTGQFEASTKNAVEQYQAAHHMALTGIVGQTIWGMLIHD